MEFFSAIIAGVLIAIIASVTTVFFSFRQFRAERIWERKYDAYTRIFESLYDLMNYPGEELEASAQGRELPEEKNTELAGRYRRARDEISRALSTGSLSISEEAQNRLQKYVRDAAAAKNTTMWTDHVERDLSAAYDCLKDMEKIAKFDLKRTADKFLFRNV